MRKIIFVSILILSLWNAEAGAQNVTLWITENFSQNCLLDKETLFENKTAAGILEKNAQVKSSFGGNFITSINGLEINAREKKSWFYYVNGVLSEVGAEQCVPNPNAVVWWDFHDWDNNVYIKAVIGAYPEPFLTGIEGIGKTTILHTASLGNEARVLKNSLEEKGASDITVKLCGRDSFEKEAMFIVMGSWQDLSGQEVIKDMFENYKRLDIFVKFNEDKMQVMDMNFNAFGEFERASVITAVKTGFGETGNIIWFITGTDDESVKEAVNILLYAPQKIRFYSAAVICGGKISNAPCLP